MARVDFINQLRALGLKVQDAQSPNLIIDYSIPIGPNKGMNVRLGLQMNESFPMNCPPGPHFESVGVQDWIEPSNAIHGSPFGPQWRYWSRPFKEWNRTEKTAKVYMAHIRKLLAELR